MAVCPPPRPRAALIEAGKRMHGPTVFRVGRDGRPTTNTDPFTMLRVTPVYGSSRHSNDGAAHTPSCTLIEYGGVRVLCNVGWNNNNDSSSNNSSNASSDNMLNNMPEHEVLLITDSTLSALGALPLYIKHPQRSSRMYATFPTVKMGQMTLYDHHANLSLDGVSPLPYTLDDIDVSCSYLSTIKYSQSIIVNDPTTNQPALSITAHRAGHVVGGAFFVLKRILDETIVVVTSTYHVAKELVLDSATLLKHGATPDVLITKPGGPAMEALAQLYNSSLNSKPILPPPLVSQSHKLIVETILQVLRRDGHVLCPVDASGRVLELLLLLSNHWDKHRLSATYNLIWLGSMVHNVLDFARSQLEWMAAPLGQKFDSQRGHPFLLNNVELCTNVSQVEKILGDTQNNPSVVLASGLTLDHGPARDLMVKWADNPDHAIVFTDSSGCIVRNQISGAGGEEDGGGVTTAPSSLQAGAAVSKRDSVLAAESSAAAAAAAVEAPADDEEGGEGAALLVGSALLSSSEVSRFSTSAQLLNKWVEAKKNRTEMADMVAVDVNVPHRAPLAGPALQKFQKQEEAARLAKKQLEERQAMLREVELAKGRLRLGEQQQQQQQQDDADNKRTAAGTGRTMTTTRPKKKSRFDSTLFLKFSKPLHLSFEVVEEAVGIGQSDSIAKYGIGESVGRSGEVLEDDYGIAVNTSHFVDIVTGVDPSKFVGGTGRIGEEVLRRGFGFGVNNNNKNDGNAAAGGGGALDGGTTRLDALEELDIEMDEQALEAQDLSEGTGIVRGRNGRQPIKVSTVPRRLEVLAEIEYVPLEGRVDARSARQSVRALQPRQVVVLGGQEDEDEEEKKVKKEDEETLEKESLDGVKLLADAIRSYLNVGHQDDQESSSRVFTPSDGETVELNVGHAAYAVRLVDTPYQTKEEKEAAAADEEESLVPEPVELYEAKVGPCTASLLDYVATGQRVALDGSIVLAPRSATPGTSSLYVSAGDVLLTDLRAEVIAQGMKAEYSAHAGYSQLIVNGKVIVKKDQETGKIDVEGPLCEDFFTVRSVVCGQYVTL